jgi:PAS domain S-box-containing protein
LSLPGLDRQILCMLTDKTENEKARTALAESAESYRSLVESAPVGVILLQADGTILNWNRMASEIFGLTEAEALGKDIHLQHWNTFRPDGAAWPAHEYPSAVTLTTGRASRDELMRLVDPQGDDHWLSINTEPLFQDDRAKPCAVIIIVSDITEHKRMESQIENANWTTANILNSMPAAIIVTDGAGCVTHFNTKAQEVFDKRFKDVSGLGLLDVLPNLPVSQKTLDAIRVDRTAVSLEKVLLSTLIGIRIADIQVYPLEASGLDHLVIVIEDVTERVRLEGMMAQTEKLISVGGLAAGMAHEINNPLGGIIQGTQVILRRLDPKFQVNLEVAEQVGVNFDTLLDYLNRREILTLVSHVRESAIRAAFIVSSMLEFSRRCDEERAPVDIAKLLDKAVELSSIDYDLKQKFDFRKIEIIKEYDPNLPPVSCTATQIEQVFLNLLRNAAHALSERQAGCEPPRITLRTSRENGMARIELEDNGSGISEDIRNRIFEAFFTTKRVGEGTGLGLSVSYFIVTKNHAGTIEVDSVPGQGTRFIIRLPLGQASTGTVGCESVPI